MKWEDWLKGNVKLTGKQRVLEILKDGEFHHGYDIIRREKFHKFTSRVSDLNDEYPNLIEIVPTGHHYKLYKLN